MTVVNPAKAGSSSLTLTKNSSFRSGTSSIQNGVFQY
jgi:hypothetical protein